MSGRSEEAEEDEDRVPESCLAHLRSEARTWFVLDLIREQKEDLRQLRKDELIKHMAKQQRMHLSTIPLPPNTHTMDHSVTVAKDQGLAEHKRSREESTELQMSEAAKEATKDMGMAIMGMIRDQRVERAHRENGVIDEPLASPNDVAIRQKFDKP